MKKVFIPIISTLIFISTGTVTFYQKDVLENRIARIYYDFFPIQIACEFPEGIQQEMVRKIKVDTKRDFPDYEPSGLILIKPLGRIGKTTPTVSDVYLDGICQAYSINGKNPKGIIVFDNRMQKIGDISVTEINQRGKWAYFTTSISPSTFGNPHKAVLDYDF